MTIIIEHYPCRQPAMAALIRGALETDPSKAQWRSDAAVNTPLGGETALGLAALKATSHSPSGQSTNNSVSYKDPSYLPFSLLFLPISLYPCLSGLRSFRTHPAHHLLKSNQSKYRLINHILLKNESKKAAVSLWHQMDDERGGGRRCSGKKGNGPNGFQNILKEY